MVRPGYEKITSWETIFRGIGVYCELSALNTTLKGYVKKQIPAHILKDKPLF